MSLKALQAKMGLALYAAIHPKVSLAAYSQQVNRLYGEVLKNFLLDLVLQGNPSYSHAQVD